MKSFTAPSKGEARTQSSHPFFSRNQSGQFFQKSSQKITPFFKTNTIQKMDNVQNDSCGVPALDGNVYGYAHSQVDGGRGKPLQGSGTKGNLLAKNRYKGYNIEWEGTYHAFNHGLTITSEAKFFRGGALVKKLKVADHLRVRCRWKDNKCSVAFDKPMSSTGNTSTDKEKKWNQFWVRTWIGGPYSSSTGTGYGSPGMGHPDARQDLGHQFILGRLRLFANWICGDP